MRALAAFAAEEFARRRGAASRKLAAGEWTAERADRMLRPWLAIAAAAGADLPELLEDVVVIYPPSSSEAVGQQKRRKFASEICPAADWREALARARDACLSAPPGSGEARHRAGMLVTLANALGVRPCAPQPVAQGRAA